MTADADAHVLVSDEERSHLVEALRRHLLDGRIDLASFEERVAVVMAARRRGEAEGAFADLPLLHPVDRAGAKRASRRRSRSVAPGPGWRATDELFRDPASGRLTRVWVDPTDGSRHYLPD